MDISFTFLGIYDFAFTISAIEFAKFLKSGAIFSKLHNLNSAEATALMVIILAKEYDKDFDFDAVGKKCEEDLGPGIHYDIKLISNVSDIDITTDIVEVIKTAGIEFDPYASITVERVSELATSYFNLLAKQKHNKKFIEYLF